MAQEATSKLTLRHRKYLDKLLDRPGPFTDPDSFVPGNHETLERAKVL
jgi:ubiquitin-activating enzyme E1 C